MPVLGICRGMQMLNVACGGTLDQHLPDALGHDDHRHDAGHVRRPRGAARARLARRPGGRAPSASTVKSHHHQGVDRLGEGLASPAGRPSDELVEAIELPDRALRARRALAPRGGRDEPRDRGARRGGASAGGRRAMIEVVEPATEQVMARGARAPASRRPTPRSRAPRRPSRPGARSRPATGPRCCTRSPTRSSDSAEELARARGAQRRQADRRRPRRDGDGRRDLPLLRRRARSACSATRSRWPAAST